ncbi:MAG TPA: S8 family serine peptidase [Saprospiraceae bacterium]|nr:S8 family serine peptidase [Saprospiraceae bacterium]
MLFPIRLLSALALLCFLALFPISHPAYGQALNYRQGQLLVQFQGHTNGEVWLQQQARSRSRSVLSGLKAGRALGPVWNIWLLEFDFSQYTSTELIRELKQHPEILQAQKNHLIQSRQKPNDPFYDRQWHHFNDGSNGRNPMADFDSEMAWDLSTGGVTERGDTIVLCVIDDGVDILHEDLIENLWVNRSEIPSNGVDDDGNGYIDDYQGWNTFKGSDLIEPGKHGTPVCGLAGARGNNKLGIAGINWQVKIMFVAGGGDEANALESYAYPLWFRRQYNQTGGREGAFVVATNSSWGTDNGKPEDAPLWCAIYDSLGAEGILNVASTTNQNLDVDVEGDLPTTCESDFLVAVTNMNDLNEKDFNSGYGKKSIDLGAYGESVYSTYINNGYRSFSGTSAAAPQVTGAVALLYSLSCNNLAELALQQPADAAREAKRILLNSAAPNPSLEDKCVSGGVLNLHQALLAVSPIWTAEVNQEDLLLNWAANSHPPAAIRYRVKGSANWNEMPVTGKSLKIQGLESCTEYEIQYRNLCPRQGDQYSLSRIIKTKGCCDAPYDLKVLQISDQDVEIRFKDPNATSQLSVVLRKAGTADWDTFVLETVQSQFQLNQLEPCSQYEIQAFSYCNNKPTPPSAPFSFSTDGCEACSSLDYCRRLRPSSDLEWLESISINNLPFQSGNNAGYGNFIGSNHAWTLEKSRSYPVRFQAGYLSDSSQVVVAAWIDYNQDGFFDNSENFALPTSKFVTSQSLVLKIPSDALTGWTRMRICLRFAEISDATPLACFQSLEFGEYEDYCVYLTGNICPKIQLIEPVNIGNQSAQFNILHSGSSSYTFAYRKLYGANWQTGSTSNPFIELNPLDSCSQYELQVQAICPEMNSPVIHHRFKTRGTNCLVNSDPVDLEDLRAYPNPFQELIRIEHPDLSEIQSIRLFTHTGQLVWMHESKFFNGRIELDEALPGGLYFLQLQSRSGSQKVIPLVRM